MPLGFAREGRALKTTSQETGHCMNRNRRRGRRLKVTTMTVMTQTAAKADTGLPSTILTAALGIGIMFIAGFAGSETLHDAQHDMRHATGFPCH